VDENWATLWESVADAMPEDLAVAQGTRRLHWAELDDRASRMAAALEGLGLGPESKVAIVAYNTPEHLEAVFAAYKLRACPINLNFRYRAEELAEVLEDSESEALFFHGSLASQVARARDAASRLRAVIQIDDGSPMLDGALPFEDLVRAHDPAPRIHRSGDDIQLLYTGGTTGHPRGVMYRHADAVEMNAFAAYALSGLAVPDDAAAAARCALALRARGHTPTVLPASPLVHGTALNLSAAAWLLGGTVVFLESRSFDGHELWRAVEEEGVTQIGIVGDAFAAPMVEALEEAEARGRPYDVSTVERVLSSGAPWSPRLKQGLADRGAMTLVETIGASEGGPTAVAIVPPGTSAQDGRFMLGERARLLAEDGTPLPPGSIEAGLLAMMPPIPFAYFKDPERSAQVFRRIDNQRYSICGDYARLHADGSVEFLGRGALCINTGGEKVYPEEVEAALRTHPSVLDANVVGLTDEVWNQAVTAIVALRPGWHASEDEIKASVRDRLAGYKVPKNLVFVPDIPRSPAGKADYEWARSVATDALASPTAPSAGSLGAPSVESDSPAQEEEKGDEQDRREDERGP
jgi:3-oxocholest-4-en-26-oate---CoA ligase